MQTKHKNMQIAGVIFLVSALVLGACAAPAPAPEPVAAAPAPEPTKVPAVPATDVPFVPAAAVDWSVATAAVNMDDLTAAAQVEGALNVITLPVDWCNYGEMIDSFSAKYGIKVNSLNPDGGSADEIQAIKDNKENKGPQAPDVIDVGPAYGPTSKEEGLLAPYKVATWDTIVGDKDPDGYYVVDYNGVMVFEVNTDVVKDVPKDWADLLDPKYKGQVALAGDPRASNQAAQSVFAAGMASGGTLDDTTAGLEFFKKLNASGNLLPLIAGSGTIAKGETPITFQWNYLALANADTFAGNPPLEIVYPSSVNWGGYYLQAISAYAPHPAAARLWQEYLYSDVGQLTWMKGYCTPSRLADMISRNVVPDDIKAKLPDPKIIETSVVPKGPQLKAARANIKEKWDTVVGLDIKKAP